MLELFGHEALLADLALRRKKNKWPQAIMFVGITGIGKGLLVEELARQTLCEELKGCGFCRSCHQVDTGSHPDLFLVTKPEGKSLIPIDLLREMEEWERLTPVVNRGKVVIIDGAESLTEESQNALLKILEEPSQDVKFLITANGQDNLLPTVSARCFVVKMSPLGDKDLKKIAKKNNWGSVNDIDIQLANGSARQLALLLNHHFSEFTVNFVKNLSHASAVDVVRLAQGIFEFHAGLDVIEDQDPFTEKDFAAWILNLIKLMLEDAARSAEDVPPKYFDPKSFASFRFLMQRSSRDHRLDLANELLELQKDLKLNLSPLAVVEAGLRAFYEKRYVQQD
jgi:DNA polymerase III gamma/tau subunit